MTPAGSPTSNERLPRRGLLDYGVVGRLLYGRRDREPAPRRMGRPASREAILLWAAAFAAIVATRVFTAQAALTAAICFLYLPGLVVWRRGEDYGDYGAPLSLRAKDLAWGLGFSAAVLPVFAAAFLLYAEALKNLPDWVLPLLGPYTREYHFSLRVPDKFWQHVINQFLVVGLSEEFFYRGYMQSRLRDAWPGRRTLLGVKFGAAFWVTQVLFAVGHLAEFHVWRLGVFFPAILFGILREKTGAIWAGVIFHALSNLAVMTLEYSFGFRG